MMQTSTSLTFMDSSIIHDQYHRINPILMTLRQAVWTLISLCSGEALAYLLPWAGVSVPSSVLFSLDCWLLSGCVLLLMDCTAWTSWRRLVSSASQACSSVVVLGLSQPSTRCITSTPLLTTIWRHKTHGRGFFSNPGNVNKWDFILSVMPYKTVLFYIITFIRIQYWLTLCQRRVSLRL